MNSPLPVPGQYTAALIQRFRISQTIHYTCNTEAYNLLDNALHLVYWATNFLDNTLHLEYKGLQFTRQYTAPGILRPIISLIIHYTWNTKAYNLLDNTQHLEYIGLQFNRKYTAAGNYRLNFYCTIHCTLNTEFKNS